LQLGQPVAERQRPARGAQPGIEDQRRGRRRRCFVVVCVPALQLAAAEQDSEGGRELVEQLHLVLVKRGSSLSRISSTLPQQPWRSRQTVINSPPTP
jgi:hypothetical protein